ncbi:hypothetical protein [Streptomyces sp. NPDC048361]|uniref:hypothetical protein n=1 Tax=Streptomyces sp. NPDC048361 TaxID=3154720 RepID=UPI00342939DB
MSEYGDPVDVGEVPDVEEWVQAFGGGLDYLDYLAQHAGLGEWAAFARVLMPRFVEVEGCVLWDRAYDPANFRGWKEQLQGDVSRIEATLNQFRLWQFIDLAEDPASEAGARELADRIALSWRRSLAAAFPQRAFEVVVSHSEDGPVVGFSTAPRDGRTG